MPQASDVLSSFDDATKDAVHAAIRTRPTRREHEGAMAAVWFDDVGQFLELQDAYDEGYFALRDAAQGFALAALVKHGISLSSKQVVLVDYVTSLNAGPGFHHSGENIERFLVPALASIGIKVLDIAIVLDDTIHSLSGKIAPQIK